MYILLYIRALLHNLHVSDMKKLEKYNSVKEMKATTTTKKVSAAVVEERHNEFASFIHYLRGDDVKTSSENNKPANKIPHELR